MTTLREAAQQALEALERCVSTCFDQYAHEQVMSRPEHFVNQTIAALRAVLAEPVQEPVAWVYASIAGSVALHIVKPVGVAKASFIQSKLDNDMQVAKEYPNAHSCTPLYAAPPQRKPLAEWQINDLIADIDPEDVCSWSFRQGVYAAEKHHGVRP